MALRRNQKGHWIISSRSRVKEALGVLEDKQFILAGLLSDPKIVTLQEEVASLKADIDAFVIDNEDYEDDDYKLTRVQGFRRSWDVTKLETILPRGIFKNIVKVEADPIKIDEYVRSGKIKAKQIEPAFSETPNKPYVKMTKKSHAEERGEAEAGALAAKLGQ
jgi:hypothetical protein